MKITKTVTLPKLRTAVLMLATAGIGSIALHAQDTPPAPPADAQGPPPDASMHNGPMGGGPGRGMNSERQVQMMTKMLDLTPDQVTRLKAIDADSMQQMMALHNDTSRTPETKRTMMMDYRKERETKIKAMLTDEQKAKYDEMQARMRERRMEHNGQGNGDAPPPPPPPSQQ